MKQYRLSKLEKQLEATGASGEPVKMYYHIDQDKDDPDLFHGKDTSHRREDLDSLREQFKLIMALWPGHKHEDN